MNNKLFSATNWRLIYVIAVLLVFFNNGSVIAQANYSQTPEFDSSFINSINNINSSEVNQQNEYQNELIQAQGDAGAAAVLNAEQKEYESLLGYIEGNYKGKSVIITTGTKQVLGKAIVEEVIVSSSGYRARISDEAEVSIKFECYQQEMPYHEKKYANYNNRLHRQEMLERRMVLEKSISSLASGLFSENGSNKGMFDIISGSDANSMNFNKGLQAGNIEYFDLATKRNKLGPIIIKNNKIYLNDGTPITIRFEAKEQV
jgi:hypothetical protein